MKRGIISFFSLLGGVTIGILGTERIMRRRAEQNNETADKYLSLFLMMNQWVRAKQEGRDFISYFERKGYREIAIYGMSYAGRTLVRELENSTVKIRYCIDQNADIDYEGIDIILPEDLLEPVDAIIVTPITFFTDIEGYLNKKVNCPIISLEDILYDM